MTIDELEKMREVKNKLKEEKWVKHII
jgi:hypothetical protein